jgi:hypothetical protein
MLTRLSDSPRFALPRQLPQVHAPMVYVYEKQAWEYKIVVRSVSAEAIPSEQELNTLGADGWELAGVVPLPEKVQFYFKRIRK